MHGCPYKVSHKLAPILADASAALSRRGGPKHRERESERERRMAAAVTKEWWNKMTVSLRRVWFGVARRLGFRNQRGAGLLKLDKDVRTCGYEDVHVMWELLRQNEGFSATRRRRHHQNATTSRQRGRHFWKLFAWARRAPFVYHP